MRRLLLLRHGKAESPHGVSDRDRPLAARGRAQSAYAGVQAREHGWEPGLAIVSPAVRARQTWEAFAGAFPAAPEVDFDARVYANTVDDLLEAVAESPVDAATVLVVGHNPSVAGLAATLDDDVERRLRVGVVDAYPTGMLTVFEVDVPWGLVAPGTARLVEGVRRP